MKQQSDVLRDYLVFFKTSVFRQELGRDSAHSCVFIVLDDHMFSKGD